MTASDRPSVENLSSQLRANQQLRFSGELEVRASGRQRWSLFFLLGRLIWATGGQHPVRRWHRLLAKYSLQLEPNIIGRSDAGRPSNLHYSLLTAFVRQQKLTRGQAVALIQDTISEVFFDVLQQGASNQLSLTCRQQHVSDVVLTLIHAEQALQRCQQAWEAWCSAGLRDYSPNLAPVLLQPEQLRQQVSAGLYQKLVAAIDGKRTLRELASLMRKDPLLLTRSLMPYLHKQWVGLTQVPDRLVAGSAPSGVRAVAVATAAPLPLPPPDILRGPLIACVDDSPIDCQLMEEILTRAGCRCISIRDPVQALPILLEDRPDLIFLDLVMPIANGYEICTQIRRVSSFKNTPVVILTGNDGIVDRVRAKLSGSSDFLAKPIENDKVLTILRKYLPVLASSQSNPFSWHYQAI